jgi:ATP-dependent helicase/nuclease subunit B
VHRQVTSASYASLLESAADFLVSLPDHPEVLVIAPTRGAADDFVHAVCRNGAGVLGVHCTTLTGLAMDLAGPPLAHAGLAPLTGLAMEAMVARVIHQLKAQSIPYFQPVADTPGLARAVARSIAEVRLNGVSPDQLSNAGSPGRDLARMVELFEQELANRSVADFATVVRSAIGVAHEGRHRLLGLPMVLLDIDPDAKLLRELLESVLAHAPEMLDARMVSGSSAGTPACTLDRVRQSLFTAAVPAADAPDQSVVYFSAAGESLECVEIARRICMRAAEGTPFDRMAILLRSPERYQPMVEEALRRAAIPAYFSRGVARPDPAGRAFLALLACAAEGCSATRFAEYLSLGQAPRLDRPAAEPAPPRPDDEVLARLYEGSETVAERAESESAETLPSPAAWEKLLVDAAVIGGRDRWERRLRGLAEEFRVRLADLGPKEEGRRQHLLNEIERLQNLERFALPIIERLAVLPPQGNWSDWIAQLGDLANAALRQPGSVRALLDELEAMDAVGPVGLDEVSGVLRERLRFLRREPESRRYGQVFVSGIEEARGRSFEVIFLPGLCEGLFPSRAREDPVLLDVYRTMLAAGLRVQDHRVADERRRLHIACAAAEKRLVFSYPRVDAVESRPRVPSFYALEIVRAAQGRLPDLRTFEEDARRGAPSRLDWPAPIDPREAIDDAEFDLATLGPILDSKSDAAGAAHYLTTANPYLVESLRRYARRNRTKWFAADGVVNPDAATLKVLAGQRLAARSYSPSALQHFAACPYRFLLYAIYGFRPREESVALEQMDPLTRGALFHEVQVKLFTELKHSQLLPIRKTNQARVLAVADAVMDRVAADYEERLAPAIPRVWRSEIDGLRTDLHGWIERVASEPDNWLPLHFELGFGLARDELRDPQSTPDEVVLEDGTRLRGAMDLVERDAASGDLRITDHKTGKVPDPEPAYVGGGAYLQPLAYAMAAENLLGAEVESSRLFYCTQRGGYREIHFRLDRPERAFFKQAMKLIDGEIARGFLPASPHRGACGFCDYGSVCGPNEERRTAKKDQSELEALLELRRMP